MTTSIIMKKKIAKSFKNLFMTYSFDKISVSKIMEDAHIRRQTFYDHFIDKYDLMNWIFINELQEQITDNLTFVSGFSLLKELCLFFQHNKDFYHNLFTVVDQNDFSSYFYEYCYQLINKILKENCATLNIYLTDVEKELYATYHTHAVTQMIKSSLEDATTNMIELFPIFKRIMLNSLHNF